MSEPVQLQQVIDQNSYPSLAAAKDAYKAKIPALRDDYMSGGFMYMGYLFDSDDLSRLNIIGTCGAVTAGIPLPASFAWRNRNNVDVPMTGPQMIGMGAVLLQFVNKIYVVSRWHKAAIDTYTTYAELVQHNFDLYWTQ